MCAKANGIGTREAQVPDSGHWIMEENPGDGLPGPLNGRAAPLRNSLGVFPVIGIR